MKIKIFASILLFLIIPAVYAGTDEYKYFRVIDTDLREPVWVQLDINILDNSQSEGKDILLYSDAKILPYHLEYQQGTAAVPIDRVIASSEQPTFRGTSFTTENMLDDSIQTFYQNDFSKDPSSTTIVVYLPDIYKVEELVFDFIDGTPNVTVYGDVDGEKRLITSSKTERNRLNSIRTNKLTITLDHDGTVKISKLDIIGETFGKLLFRPISDRTWIYYGKANDEGIDYDTEGLYTTVDTKTVKVSRQYINPGYKGNIEGGIDDNCPGVKNPDQTDSDNDGVGDSCDDCKYTANNDQEDIDKDGIGDVCDNCRLKSNPDQLDKDLDGIGWVCDDDDDDKITNDEDNCLKGYNPDQQDIDRDGIGDACEDDDDDGVLNYLDLCKEVMDSTNNDVDKDGIGDVCDNCPKIMNKDQKDSDSDGIGDKCEDKDNDGVADSIDNCPLITNSDQIDWDKDGIGDKCDNCPEIRNSDQSDVDRDGIGDVCDKEESRVLENPTVVWSIMIIAAVFLVGMAFFLKKK